MSDEPYNLKPIIADLQVKLASNLRPLINKQSDTGIKGMFDPKKKVLPPLAPVNGPKKYQKNSSRQILAIENNYSAMSEMDSIKGIGKKALSVGAVDQSSYNK